MIFTQHNTVLDLTTLLLVSLHFAQVFVEKHMTPRYLTMLLENTKMYSSTLELPATAMATEKEMDFSQTIHILGNITDLRV